MLWHDGDHDGMVIGMDSDGECHQDDGDWDGYDGDDGVITMIHNDRVNTDGMMMVMMISVITRLSSLTSSVVTKT